MPPNAKWLAFVDLESDVTRATFHVNFGSSVEGRHGTLRETDGRTEDSQCGLLEGEDRSNWIYSDLRVHFILYTRLALTASTDVVDTAVSPCARYHPRHGCKEVFWTAGQRYDLDRRPSPFVWKQTPGTGSCCGGTCMSEMRYTSWGRGEPSDASNYDANLNPVSPPLPEKCLHLCRGWNHMWNDALCEIPTCSICEVDIWGSHASKILYVEKQLYL